MAHYLQTCYTYFLNFCGEAGNNVNCECCYKIKELVKDNFLYKYLHKFNKDNLIGKSWIDFEKVIAYIVDDLLNVLYNALSDMVKVLELYLVHTTLVRQYLYISLGLV